MAYLITCSGSKRIPSENSSSIDLLSYPDLKIYRERLIEISGVTLDWGKTLPAFQLYSGIRSKLYPQVAAHNWSKSCIKIKILSALFGWINHTDLVPIYDLKMDQRIGPENKFVYNIWNEFAVLNTFINPLDIDLLSITYKKAINKNCYINCIQPSVRFTDRGVQKGKWLNRQLEIISVVD